MVVLNVNVGERLPPLIDPRGKQGYNGGSLPHWESVTLADWQTTTRYYPFSRFVRETFGCKVRKVVVNGGFSCPNRDGTIGGGGCSYCVNESFSPAADKQPLPIHEQVAQAIAQARERGREEKFMVYLQPFTNTYADVATLKSRYDEAVAHEEVVALAIGTRPDCVPDDVLDLIESYTARGQVWIEYGLQSASDRTLERINRGHGWAEFEDAVTRTRPRGILVCAHVILGLPGETRDDMRETANRLAALGIDGVKLHHLAIVRGSPLAEEFRRGLVPTLTSRDYASLAADMLERLPETVAVQRLVGDTCGDLLIAPVWAETKQQIIAAITEELAQRGSCQGALWRLGQ